MIKKNRRTLSPETVISLTEQLRNSAVTSEYFSESHIVQYYDQINNKICYIRLPIQINWDPKSNCPETLDDHYIILLVQSGSSAIGLFKMGEVVDHKVIKAYMVRKKQGKSQIKHLKTKGKSRAGSRIRLANTLHFFEDIHERMNRYLKENKVARIAISCSKTLLPFLFSERTELAFNKDDSRIINIPMHVNVPGYKILLHVHQFMCNGEIQINDPDHPLLGDISIINNTGT